MIANDALFGSEPRGPFWKSLSYIIMYEVNNGNVITYFAYLVIIATFTTILFISTCIN